jgi:hypothetical protein
MIATRAATGTWPIRSPHDHEQKQQAPGGQADTSRKRHTVAPEATAFLCVEADIFSRLWQGDPAHHPETMNPDATARLAVAMERGAPYPYTS